MQISIAENIRRFRSKKGFTQSDLAILLSVSAQAVSRWESGQAFPDITLLPLLAKYLNVSIDKLLEQEGQRNKTLKKELHERMQVIINNEAENIQNKLRILDIYEELGHTEDIYLNGYFQQLMCVKKDEKLNIIGLDERITTARQMIRNRLKTANMHDRISLLNSVVSFEDEDKLELWTEEYLLPQYMKSNIGDELMLSRYIRQNNIDKINIQNQKILYEQIKNIVFYLTDSVYCVKEKATEFNNPARYKMALDTLSLYSTHVDDIFIFDRIVLEERYAQALLFNGLVEDSLAMFSQINEHLSILYHLSEGCILHGSVPVLNTVQIVIEVNDKLECAMNMGGYEKNPLFDQIRDNERFTKYITTLEKFFPQQKCRSWVNEKGENVLDVQWEMLINRAKMEADKLSDGNVIAIITAQGTFFSLSFQDVNSETDHEKILKDLIEIKKNGTAKIERLICMWHDGCIDLPSFAFREELLSIDSSNYSTKLLLNGLSGYIVKTVRETMPKGYDS